MAYDDSGDGALTEEQREWYRRNMPDLVGARQDMARQMAIADQLRTPQSRSGHWTGQLQRAMAGTYGGYQDRKRDELQKQTRDQYGYTMRNAPGRSRRAPNEPITDPSGQAELFMHNRLGGGVGMGLPRIPGQQPAPPLQPIPGAQIPFDDPEYMMMLGGPRY